MFSLQDRTDRNMTTDREAPSPLHVLKHTDRRTWSYNSVCMSREKRDREGERETDRESADPEENRYICIMAPYILKLIKRQKKREKIYSSTQILTMSLYWRSVCVCVFVASCISAAWYMLTTAQSERGYTQQDRKCHGSNTRIKTCWGNGRFMS